MFNYDLLKQVCLSPIDGFCHLGTVTETRDGIHIYQNNDSPVLAVAHLDSVLDLEHFYVNRINGDDLIFNAQLDDRLGAYTILDVLPKLGINCDVLLTEGEEQGRSTAAHFKAGKSYNWAFSFDRKGEDVVTYQYNGKDWEDALKASKFRVGVGSFSDIAFLGHLGIKCVNIGTGYHGEHDDLCYASANQLERQVKRFEHFYNVNKNVKYPHKETKGGFWGRFGSFGSSRTAVVEYTDYDGLMCALCHGRTGTQQFENNTWLCAKCWADAEQCTVCEEINYSYDLIDGICYDCIEDMKEDN